MELEEYKTYEGDDFIGHQRIYKFPNNFGVSVRTKAVILHYYPFYAEIAVLKFNGEKVKDRDGNMFDYFELTYDTPITNDVKILSTEEEVIEILKKVKDLEDEI